MIDIFIAKCVREFFFLFTFYLFHVPKEKLRIRKTLKPRKKQKKQGPSLSISSPRISTLFSPHLLIFLNTY